MSVPVKKVRWHSTAPEPICRGVSACELPKKPLVGGKFCRFEGYLILIFLMSTPELVQQQCSPAALYHNMGALGERRTRRPLALQVYHRPSSFGKNLHLRVAFRAKSYKHISVKAKSLVFRIVGLPSVPTSVHDHCAQSVGCAGNAISHREKSSGISQGGGQNKVSNKSSYLPQCICTRRHFSCLWLQRKIFKGLYTVGNLPMPSAWCAFTFQKFLSNILLH